MRFKKIIPGCVLAASVALGGLLPAAAQDLDLSHKRVTMIVPYGEGGGSTIHARLLVPPLSKELPGEPTILIRNIDGGGSVRGINEFNKIAEPDGVTVAAIGSGTFFQYLLEDPAVNYPLSEFKPILTSPCGLLVYARRDQGLGDDPVENIRKLMTMTPVYGGANATSSDLPALLSMDLLGLKPNYVFGLSNSESRAGFDRGEMTLNYDNMASYAGAVKPLIDDGTAVPLFTFGFENEAGEMVRDPMLPDVPTFLEVYEAIHGEPLSGTAYDVWKALFNVRVMASKMFVLPKDTPQPIVDTYSKAMEAALKSEALQSEQAHLVLGEYPQSTGAVAQRIFTAATSLNSEQKQWLKAWLKATHNVN
jgi:tripartite-type tricarboxylate transporter receptor subunit TctC